MNIRGSDLAGPHQAHLVVAALCHRGHSTTDAHAVGTHGHGHQLAVLVKNLEVECVGVLAPELEDVTHLDAAGGLERLTAAGALVSVTHLGSLDRAVSCEVASGHQIDHVLALDIRSRDPAGAVDDAGVQKKPDPGLA